MARGYSKYEEGERREVPIISRGAKQWVDVYMYADAFYAGKYLQEVDDFLNGYLSYERFYDHWHDVWVGPWPLETDPNVLELLGLQGRLRIDEFYRDTN